MVNKLPTWHKDAACSYHPDPELWWYDYPHNSDKEARHEVILKIESALLICNDCPVKKECLKAGLEPDNLQPGSIWGGMLFNARRKLAKAKRNTGFYQEEWITDRLKGRLARKGVSL